MRGILRSYRRKDFDCLFWTRRQSNQRISESTAIAHLSNDRRRRCRSLVSAAGQAIRTAAPVTIESDGLTMYFVRLRGADAYQLMFITFVTRTFYDYSLPRWRRI
jgi:hypothetical protein